MKFWYSYGYLLSIFCFYANEMWGLSLKNQVTICLFSFCCLVVLQIKVLGCNFKIIVTCAISDLIMFYNFSCFIF